MFYCEYFENCKSTYFEDHLETAVFAYWSIL